ncbi:hypothetical protein EDD18DRAFT_1333808 [Armillaria luteobubalina]|uniref:Uncharacterized protein n=1 Tax=Armillaria luteobubalina TaxID=153913 RepID=A0AA39PZN0_9AGAR|nr:hypothetical protein EDD18DRAFT_1333808 [Armillaria luteobubalina]
MTSQKPVLAGGLGEFVLRQRLGLSTKTEVLLSLADVYSSLYIKNQLLQGYFASQGFIVVGVDYFLRDPMHIHPEPWFDRHAWLERSKQQARELMPEWLNAIYEKYGDIAHPAVLTEDHSKNIKKIDRTFHWSPIDALKIF